MSRCRLILAALTLTALLSGTAQAQAQAGGTTAVTDAAPADVVVNHEPPVLNSRTFDPKSPPPEMPPLKPGEAAVTESSFSCETLVEVLVVSQQPIAAGTCRATVRVSSATATLRLGITIWVPHRDAHKLT